MVLGGIILLLQGERYSVIRKKWLTKVFVTEDILSFFLQPAGGNHGWWEPFVHANWRTYRRCRIVCAALFLRVLFGSGNNFPQANSEDTNEPKCSSLDDWEVLGKIFGDPVYLGLLW